MFQLRESDILGALLRESDDFNQEYNEFNELGSDYLTINIYSDSEEDIPPSGLHKTF